MPLFAQSIDIVRSSILQTIGSKQGAVALTKTILFYVAITLEAFVFCFAGEYLSAKVITLSKLHFTSEMRPLSFFNERLFT